MKQILFGILLAPIFAFIVGCASSGHQINPNITVYDRAKVSKMPVELPGNYGTENYGRLTLATLPGTLTSNAFDDSNMKYMGLRMQSELAKLKRFSVYAMQGADSSILQDLADFGEIELPEQAPATVDLLASWNTNVHAEEVRSGRTKRITFNCTINLTCKDMRTGKIKFTKDLDFRVYRNQTLDRGGTVIAGYNYRSKSDVQSLFQDLATQAAIRIANELGNEYPVGGRVTGVRGTTLRMQMDCGVEQGVAKGMEMVIYAKLDGMDIPLGNATATPGVNSSMLEFWRKNTKDPDAEQILKDIQTKPDWLSKNPDTLFAVGYGMAMPPEWQTKEMYISN